LESDSDRSWRGLRGGESPDMAFSAAVEVHPRSHESSNLFFVRAGHIAPQCAEVRKTLEMEIERWDCWDLNKVLGMMLVSPK
jgi:hypothetical protein